MPAPPRTVDVPDALRDVFADAEALVGRYFSAKREAPAEGTIEIAGERYVLVRAASLSVRFFSIVRGLYGPERRGEADELARSVLFDLAHGVGRSDAADFAARTGTTDPVVRLSAGPLLFAHSGWAKVAIAPESRPTPGEDYVLFYDHPYSFESDAWLRAGERAERPVCVMNAGYSSGWCEESFGQHLVAAEITCRARGDAQCRFVMAPPDRIRAHAERRLAETPGAGPGGYQIPGLFARRSVEEKLRRAKRELEDRVRDRTRALEGEMERRERAERKLRRAQKMEAVGRLSGGVAHDFNNVLGVILGCASVLERRYPGDEAVEMIRQSATRAARLTSQLLAFSRSQLVKAEPVELGAAVDEIRAMITPALGARVELEIDVADPVTVLASEDAVQQILLNLCLNARDAMPGGGRLRLRARRVELQAGDVEGLAAGAWGQLTVEDDGVGMSEDVRERVFDPFFSTKGEDGTGLGLSSAHGIVHQFGGTLEVRSAPGDGARFDVYLPAHDGPPPPAATLGRAAPTPAGRPARILLVEDDPLLRHVVRDILSQGGHQVREAGRPSDALRLLDEGPPPELLLTDVVLPEMSGRDLAARVRDLAPGMPVLYMSGYADDDPLRRGRLREGESCLHKPFTASALLGAVDAAIPDPAAC